MNYTYPDTYNAKLRYMKHLAAFSYNSKIYVSEYQANRNEIFT